MAGIGCRCVTFALPVDTSGVQHINSHTVDPCMFSVYSCMMVIFNQGSNQGFAETHLS